MAQATQVCTADLNSMLVKPTAHLEMAYLITILYKSGAILLPKHYCVKNYKGVLNLSSFQIKPEALLINLMKT